MPITLVGTATGATSCAVPGHAIGDILLIWAVRSGSATPPTAPDFFNTIRTVVGTNISATLGIKTATTTGDSSGTWTNANLIVCQVYRPSAGNIILIGQNASSNSTTATISYPALSPFADASGNSWVAGFAGCSNITQTISTAPTGMVNRTSDVTGSTASIAGHDTNAGVSSWSLQTVNAGGAGNSVSMTVELVLSAFGTAPSNIYQHIGGGGNCFTRGNTGNAFKLPLPNPSGSGNTLILALTYDGGATVSNVTGAINGSFGAAVVTALAGSGNQDSRVYVLPNITSGQELITVTFGSAVRTFQYCLTEVYGVATSSPLNGTTSATLSATPAAGSFTPGNNNVNGGNLLWAYFCKSDEFPANQTVGVFPGSSFQLLNADIAWNNANNSLPKAVETTIQATSAAINPSIVSIAETGDNWNSLAVALKLSSGAGTPPSNTIRINGIQHFATLNFPATGMYVVQVAATGNLRCITSVDPSLNTLTVWDSEGVIWTSDGVGAGFWFRQNTTPNPNLIIYIEGGGGDAGLSFRFIDLANAATSSAFNSATFSNQGVNNVSSFTASPSPSPSNSIGMTIANVGLGQGPGLAVTAPPGAIWDLCLYTGETDLDVIENADIMAHLVYSASGAQVWIFTITNQVSNSTAGGFISFVGTAGAPSISLAWVV